MQLLCILLLARARARAPITVTDGPMADRSRPAALEKVAPSIECGLSCPGTPALRDLESPGALRVAARAHASADAQLILLASGPDSKSVTMLSNLEGMLSRCYMLTLAMLTVTRTTREPFPPTNTVLTF